MDIETSAKLSTSSLKSQLHEKISPATFLGHFEFYGADIYFTGHPHKQIHSLNLVDLNQHYFIHNHEGCIEQKDIITNEPWLYPNIETVLGDIHPSFGTWHKKGLWKTQQINVKKSDVSFDLLEKVKSLFQ